VEGEHKRTQKKYQSNSMQKNEKVSTVGKTRKTYYSCINNFNDAFNFFGKVHFGGKK